MNILVTGANGQLGNGIRIVSAGSADRYIFTDVNEAGQDQVAMLRKLAGPSVDISTRRLDICDIDAVRRMVADESHLPMSKGRRTGRNLPNCSTPQRRRTLPWP